MNLPKPTIMAIDDEKSMLVAYDNLLKKDYQVVLAPSASLGLKTLAQQVVDVVILDIRLPRLNGIETLKRIKKRFADVEVIMVTASNEALSAVEALKLGAADYLMKPFEARELFIAIEKALEKRALIRENLFLKETLAQTSTYCDLIGNSPKMKAVFETIAKVAINDSRVLITGESGTGKELVARAIHLNSQRQGQPFVAVNCAALPESLLESELFGHERGSFTGAMERKPGKFELANGGTIFLDEIGCMPASMQAKLLRTIQENSLDRVGGTSPVNLDIRLISATNINFVNALAKKLFREDLYYRLNVIPIHLPPLRERVEDIPLFLNYFLEKFSQQFNKPIEGFNQTALEIFMNYDWPGNVRELQNVVERLVTLCFDKKITEDHVRTFLNIPNQQLAPSQIQRLKDALETFERNHILRALAETEHNRSQAARLLGVARSTLMSKIHSLGMN